MRRAFVASLLIAIVACRSSSNDRPPLGGSSGTAPPTAFGCPPSKPQTSTSCNENGLECVYAEPTFGCPDPAYAGEVRCAAGLWQAVTRDASCALPGPGCPPPEIANGFTCPADASTGICTYTTCTGAPQYELTCVDGHLKGDGPIPSCDGGTDASDAGTD